MLRAGAFFSRGVSLLTLFAGLGRLFDVRRNVTWLHTSACFLSLYDSPRGVFASGMGMVGKVDTEFSPLSFVTALVEEKGGPGGRRPHRGTVRVAMPQMSFHTELSTQCNIFFLLLRPTT